MNIVALRAADEMVSYNVCIVDLRFRLPCGPLTILPDSYKGYYASFVI
jgi:hypothetical protein